LTLMLLAACSRDKAAVPTAVAPEAKVAATAPAPSVPAALARPEGADAVDAALAGAKAFNAKAVADLASIETAEKQIRDMAARAMEAARRGDGGRVTAARTDAEAAHKRLADGLASLQTTAAAQTAALEGAAALCAPVVAAPGLTATPAPLPPPAGSPVLAASEGCLALPAEQALLAQNVTALQARYEATETAYRQDRARLDEAAATMALGR
jgi:hypothetical protein